MINFQRREDEEAMQEQLDAVEAMPLEDVYPTSPPPLEGEEDLSPMFLRSYVLIKCFVLWYSIG